MNYSDRIKSDVGVSKKSIRSIKSGGSKRDFLSDTEKFGNKLNLIQADPNLALFESSVIETLKADLTSSIINSEMTQN